MSTLIAIDPGASGGVAVMLDGEVSCLNMPKELSKRRQMFLTLDPDIVVIEDVGYHRQGNHAQSSATFARHVGELNGMLAMLDCEVVQATPKEWMKDIPQLPRDKAERKKEIQRRMQAMYPHLKVTLKVADALCMLYWYKFLREHNE